MRADTSGRLRHDHELYSYYSCINADYLPNVAAVHVLHEQEIQVQG